MTPFSQNILSFTQSQMEPRFLLHSGKNERFSILGIGKKQELSLINREKNILDDLFSFWGKFGKEKKIDAKNIPFQGGIFIFLSYDLIENFESIKLKHPVSLPKIYAVVPEDFYIFDHETETVYGTKEIDFSSLSDFHLSTMNEHVWKTTISQNEYEKNVQKIQQEIFAGNTFQVNYSQRFLAKQNASSFEIFKHLCTINPSPFSAFVETPFGEIISGSPERLVSLRRNVLETKPIAGTRKRSEKKDELFEQELHTNTKEQAEHAMIVDLERNDMGRVSEFGSVKVEKYAHIEKYSHVQHLVSTIQSKLSPDKIFCDVIRAMHPGGTITGCPKYETCKIINEFELFNRGVYTGALGYINHAGDMDLNILIRTIFAHNGILETQAGGGVVFDSDPEREYKETLHKASAQFAATNGVLHNNR